MRWKSYSPYILAVALVGLSGGVLAAVAGDTASVDRMAAEPAPEAAVAPTLASALGPAALPAAGLLLSCSGTRALPLVPEPVLPHYRGAGERRPGRRPGRG